MAGLLIQSVSCTQLSPQPLLLLLSCLPPLLLSCRLPPPPSCPSPVQAKIKGEKTEFRIADYALDQLGDQVGLWEGGLQAASLAAWQGGGAWGLLQVAGAVAPAA